MEHQSLDWKQNNTTIHSEFWKVENAKANIVIVHGMGEHLGRYADFVIPKLNEAGFSVLAFDHFGHGKTTGKRGHCPSYEAVQDMIQNALNQSKKSLGDAPLFLYGHSMGGNAVSNFILKNEDSVKGAILTSPMLRIAFEPPAWKMIAGKIMRHIYPAFTEKTGLDTSAISRDKAEVEKYIADPLIHDDVSVNFSLPFFDAGEWAIANANNLKIPTLLTHGTGDTITSHIATQEFVKNAGDMATIKLFEGAYHEVHTESAVKEEMMQTIIDWINNQL